MNGRAFSVVLDCPDPHALGEFYSRLLGKPITADEPDWVSVGDRATGKISFQLAPDHVPPRWPDPAFPQQSHLDVWIDDIDVTELEALALGAIWLASDDEEGFRVYNDPAGHPFCLCWK
ncbi:MAG: VOC family protein [Streptosporangiales bacterium]|nr:VOC family protein [Streptosporangiales bacterium]